MIASLVCSHLEAQNPTITLKELDSKLQKEIFRDYKTWCHAKRKCASACSHRFNAARFGKEKWSSYPELGSVYKAAVVKTMLFWCHDFLKKQVGAVPGAQARANVTHGFAKFQFMLDSNGPFLDPKKTAEIVKYARAGLLFYQDLAAADSTRADDRRFFKVIPKFHSFMELTIYMETTNRNPRFFGLIIDLVCAVRFCWFPFWSHMVPQKWLTLELLLRLFTKTFSYEFGPSKKDLFWRTPEWHFVLSTYTFNWSSPCLDYLRIFLLVWDAVWPPNTKQHQHQPRYEHCYQDEDLMKEIGRIASKTHPNTMDSVTLRRYRALIELCAWESLL